MCFLDVENKLVLIILLAGLSQCYLCASVPNSVFDDNIESIMIISSTFSVWCIQVLQI